MIKWQIDKWSLKPKRLHVISETKCFLTHVDDGWDEKQRKHRIAKTGVFDTFEEAVAAIAKDRHDQIEAVRERLAKLHRDIEFLATLKEEQCK